MSNGFLYFIYTVLFSVAVYVPEYSTTLFALVTIFNFFVYIVSPKNKNVALFSSSLIGNEMFTIVNVLAFIIIEVLRRPKKIKMRASRIGIIASFVIISSSFVSAIVYGTYINVIFYLVYLFLLVITYSNAKVEMDDREIISLVQSFIVVEVIVSLVIIIRTHSIDPGDAFGGSLLNAHFFANWLVLTLFVYLHVSRKVGRNISEGIPWIICIIGMLVLASANAVVLSALIAVGVYFVFSIKKTKGRYSIFWMIVFTYIFFAIFLLILFSPAVKSFIADNNSYLNLYLYSEGWNFKLKYFYGTFFEKLSGVRLLTGYGLGQYGSRIANAFSYDVMWRAEGGINRIIASLFQPHHIPQYTEYIKFYNKEFVDGIQWRSAVMSYPFSSFIALIGETGIIGVVTVAAWINKTFEKFPCKIIIFYFLIVCIFDIFFDDYQCVLILVFYLGFVNQHYKKVAE